MKKIFLFTFLLAFAVVACSEEELILEGDPDNNEVIVDDTNDGDTDTNDSDNGNNNDNDGNTNDNTNNSNNGCQNSGSNEVDISNEILNLVNTHRQNIGMASLALNCTATELAIEHTEYMISRNDISHDNFQARFQELQQRVNANSAGENVAAGYATAESVMNAWLNSSGHKANIEGNFTHIGIAAIKNSQGRLYFTQLFYR